MSEIVRTNKEIEEQVAKLRSIREVIPNLSFFGNDNRAAIDCQIMALEHHETEDDLDLRRDDGLIDDHEHEHGCYACQWMTGEEDEAPYDGWGWTPTGKVNR